MDVTKGNREPDREGRGGEEEGGEERERVKRRDQSGEGEGKA